MKKIVILLITVSSLFGWESRYPTDPTTIRQLYVLDETYIKHYPDELEWRNKHQVYFIHNMEQAMRKVKKGRYNKKTSQEIADLIQKYVDLEKFHREELKSLEKELTKLSK
jgi:signal transduction histidine kinase